MVSVGGYWIGGKCILQPRIIQDFIVERELEVAEREKFECDLKSTG